MTEKPIRILLIEDNPGDVRLIQEALAEAHSASFELECEERLDRGLERLSRGKIDVVLLDLSLPDSWGLDTVSKAHAQAPEVPLIVMTGSEDEDLGVKAVQVGAQDYLVKGEMDSNVIARSIRYAIERQRILAELRNLSLVDELTGLYNRRGFQILAHQQVYLIHQAKMQMVLLFADLDNMKQINDNFGHHTGDQALAETANILKATFRKLDIIARIGGDEFAILAVGTPRASAETILKRLQNNFKEHNAKAEHPYKLSLSVGIAFYDPKSPCSIEELMGRADALMYEHKRAKQNS
jgi:diguanylate cyclase (GGDEF)-like protein